jgi:hypothetical protein
MRIFHGSRTVSIFVNGEYKLVTLTPNSVPSFGDPVYSSRHILGDRPTSIKPSMSLWPGDFGAPQVCEKISKEAIYESWSFGWDVYSIRSECYFFAATKQQNIDLYNMVTHIITLASQPLR